MQLTIAVVLQEQPCQLLQEQQIESDVSLAVTISHLML
jgi:hypothetical protein